MSSTFNISVGGDTSKLERDIQRAAERVRKPLTVRVNDRASFALGNITGKTTKFNDALDAATARVVAFAAAAGAFNLVRKGVEELLRSTVEVELSLARININLNESDAGLKQFSKNVFDIARNTGQTFETAAKAAEELTRQGLTAVETTKRLKDALILSRLAGIDSDEAVKSLTASINSFSKEVLSSSEILNKLAAVDAKFAVSTADLANAISRVGSSASEAGVSFDQLIALVTSAQQITARGGAVIGNSFKTIFTRVNRPGTLDDLEALGVGVRDIQGKTLPAIDILTKLARTYDTLSDSQKSLIAQQVGGVFQINILKAVLGDLRREYSEYGKALETSTNASNEAYRKNEILNKTLSSSFNEVRQSVAQLFAEFGKVNLGPFLRAITDGLSGVAKFLSGSDVGKDAGKSIGENIMQGLGNVLTGPGVIALAAIVQSVTSTLARKVGAEFGDAVAASMLRSGAVGGIAQAGKITQARKLVPRAASGILPSILGESAAIDAGVGGASPMARPVVVPNFNFGGGKRGPVVANTDEYIVPNYAGGSGSAIFNKNMVSMYGLPRNAKKLAQGYIPNFASIYRGVNPKFGDVNAGVNSIGVANKLVAAVGRGNYTDNKDIARLYGSSIVSKNIKEDRLLQLGSYNDIVRLYDRFLPKSLASQIKNTSGSEQLRLIQGAGKNLTNILLQKGYSGIKAPFAGADNAFLKSKTAGGSLFIPFASGFIPNFGKISARKIFGELEEKKRRLSTESGSELEYMFNPSKRRIDIENIKSNKKGDAFELFSGLIQRAKRGKLPIYSGVLSRQYGQFDPKTKKYNEIAYKTEQSNYENLLRAYPQLRYRDQPGLKNSFRLSAVDTQNPDRSFERIFGSLTSAERFLNKKSKWEFARHFKNDNFSISGLTTKPFAGGYVPNFANPLTSAIAREKAAGIPLNQIYIDRDKRVANQSNPLGLLVANRRDEPLGGHQGVARVLGQGRNPAFAGLNMANGHVPNFAPRPQSKASIEALDSLSLGALPLRPGGVSGFIKSFDLSQINFDVQAAKVRKQITRAVEDSLDIDISKLSTYGKRSYSKLITKIISERGPDIEKIKAAQIEKRNATTLSMEDYRRARYGQRQKENIVIPFADIPVTQRVSSVAGPETKLFKKRAFNVNRTPEDIAGRLAEANRLRELRRTRPYLPTLFPSIRRGSFSNFGKGGFSPEAKSRFSLGLVIGGSAAAALVPQSAGGTTRGVIGGAASGALQGAANAASLFGLKGIVVGAAIGAIIGGFNKAKKSLEEFSENIDRASSATQKNVEGLGKIIGISEQLKDTSDPQIQNRLLKNIEDILPDLTPEARGRVKQGFGSDEEMRKFVSDTLKEATKTERIGKAAKETFAVASERNTGFSGFVRGQSLVKNLGVFGALVNEPIKRIIDFLDKGGDTKQAKDAGKSLGVVLTDDIVKKLTTKSASGAIERGVNLDDLNQSDIAKLQDLVNQIGVVDEKFKNIEVDETNFKGLAIQIKESVSEFRNLKKTLKDVQAVVAARPTFKNLTSFLGTNFGQEQGFQQFGRARTYDFRKDDNLQRNKSGSFLNLLGSLEQKGAFEDKGGLTNFLRTTEAAPLQKIYQRAQGEVGKAGLLEVAEQFALGFEQFKTATTRTSGGKIIESAVVSMLEILKKSQDKQTGAASSLFSGLLANKNEDLSKLGIEKQGQVAQGGYVYGEKLSTYAGSKSNSSSRYILNDKGGIPESAKEWLARGSFSNNEPSRAMVEFKRAQEAKKNDIRNTNVDVRKQLNEKENPFETSSKELVGAIEKIKNLTVGVENAFKVSVVLSPDAVKLVSSENVAAIERQIYSKMYEIETELAKVSGKPIPPAAKTTSKTIAVGNPAAGGRG